MEVAGKRGQVREGKEQMETNRGKGRAGERKVDTGRRKGARRRKMHSEWEGGCVPLVAPWVSPGPCWSRVKSGEQRASPGCGVTLIMDPHCANLMNKAVKPLILVHGISQKL